MKFLDKYPKLTESTVRNYKKMYLKKMKEQGEKGCCNQVTSIPKGLAAIILRLLNLVILLFQEDFV